MDADPLPFAGAAKQAQLVADGQVSSRELTELYLERIARLNPKLNAWRVVLADEALAAADAADARRAAGEGGILNGVPVAIKDDVDVAGQTTPCGTDAQHDRPAPADSPVVAGLRAAGAVLLGKTHVPEMTICCFTESLTFGATRNPWDPTRTPGGSSGGTGAAVASGMCAIGLGSDGGGSIRIPSAWNGLFGIKTQAGRIPQGGPGTHWNDLSVVGPLARHVEDAALFLDATAAARSPSTRWSGSDPSPVGGFLATARRAVGTFTVVVSTGLPAGAMTRVSAESLDAVRRTADLLRELGHRVEEREVDYGPAGPNLSLRYFAGIHEDVARLPHPERLEPRTRGFARIGGLIPGALVRRAVAQRDGLARRYLDSVGDPDVILTPGPVGPPFAVGALYGKGALRTVQAMAARVPFFGPFNASGQPAVSLPAGFTPGGLPLAVQLVGRPWEEATLIGLSAQLEAARPWADRRPVIA